ncbi:MAG: hypothetical protein K0S39_1844 [Paenibacillus sp.]|nr:hypothetical protein [Paenibacillus sp.]
MFNEAGSSKLSSVRCVGMPDGEGEAGFSKQGWYHDFFVPDPGWKSLFLRSLLFTKKVLHTQNSVVLTKKVLHTQNS